jgi:hypothetical protein
MECRPPSLSRKAPCSEICLIKVFLFTDLKGNKKPRLSQEAGLLPKKTKIFSGPYAVVVATSVWLPLSHWP